MYAYNLGLRFSAVASRFAERPAIRIPGGATVTYADLNATANRLARYLRDAGIARGDVVCIAGDKSESAFAAMLACLKIGAIYTILDPDSPAERLRKIIGACAPRLLFSGAEDGGGHLGETARELDVPVASGSAREFRDAIRTFVSSDPEEVHNVLGSDPAYIMYTSGSTGFPKGAVITHQSVLNLIDWSIEEYGITPSDRLTNVNPMYFDNSVFDFYSALFSGASLVPFTREVVTDARALVAAVDEMKCTQWFSVPTLLIFLTTMKALNRDKFATLKRIIFGGEGYPKVKLKKLHDLYGHRTEFFNVYGPTECTCICSSYRISSSDFVELSGFPPLGSLIRNFACLIVDESGQETPVGELGELCLLGPNVGNGYYNDPERTACSFVQHPGNHNRYRDVMYRTGDLVKLDAGDGKLHIAGRKDNQIKHMGYRIELEEIETALSRLSCVSQAAVIQGTKHGLSQIVAIVSTTGGADEDAIRRDLREIIPGYMVPTLFHVVPALPLNPNGKVDRPRLRKTYA